MSWSFATLLPHPPILVPEIGKGREQAAPVSRHAIAQVQKKLQPLCAHSATSPDVLLVLSPHHAHMPNTLFINVAPKLVGHLGHFGSPQLRFSLSTDIEQSQLLQQHCQNLDVPVVSAQVENIATDHGCMVPLYFIQQIFSAHNTPKVIVANPIGLSLQQAYDFGKGLQALATNKKWALIASGDLSHRLTPTAPAGFHAHGAVFDACVIEALKRHDPAPLFSLPDDVLHNAGECGLRSALVFLGLITAPPQILAYEGPFGVGYCTAYGEVHIK